MRTLLVDRKPTQQIVWLFLIFVLLTFSSVHAQQCLQAPAGMSHHLRFDGNLLDDVTGQAATSNLATSFETGKIGQGAYFTGTNFVTMNDDVAAIDADGSIEFWFRTFQATATPNLPAKILMSRDHAFSFGWGNTGADPTSFIEIIGPVPRPSVPLNLTVSSPWVHFAITSDATGTKLYKDGVQIASSIARTNLRAGSGTIRIGKSDLLVGTTAVVGLYDDFAMYSRALSQSEIQSIVSAGSAGKCAASVAEAVPAIEFKDFIFASSIEDGPTLIELADTTMIAFNNESVASTSLSRRLDGSKSAAYFSVSENDPNISGSVVTGNRLEMMATLAATNSTVEIKAHDINGSVIDRRSVVVNVLRPRAGVFAISAGDVISKSNSMVTLARNARTDSISVGSIVTSPSPNPILVKVISRFSTVNTLELTTSDALLVEAFEDGAIELGQPVESILSNHLVKAATPSFLCSRSGAISVVHNSPPIYDTGEWQSSNRSCAIRWVAGVLPTGLQCNWDLSRQVSAGLQDTTLGLSGELLCGYVASVPGPSFSVPFSRSVIRINAEIGAGPFARLDVGGLRIRDLIASGNVNVNSSVLFSPISPHVRPLITGNISNFAVNRGTVEFEGSIGVTFGAKATIAANIDVKKENEQLPWFDFDFFSGDAWLGNTVSQNAPLSPLAGNYSGPIWSIDAELSAQSGITTVASSSINRLLQLVRLIPADVDVGIETRPPFIWEESYPITPSVLTMSGFCQAPCTNGSTVSGNVNLWHPILTRSRILPTYIEIYVGPSASSNNNDLVFAKRIDFSGRPAEVPYSFVLNGRSPGVTRLYARIGGLLDGIAPIKPLVGTGIAWPTIDVVTTPVPPMLSFSPSSRQLTVPAGGSATVTVTPSGGAGNAGTRFECAGNDLTANPVSTTVFGSTTAPQDIVVRCNATAINRALTCNWWRESVLQTPVNFAVTCEPLTSNTPPTLSYSPSVGSTIVLQNGSAGISVSSSGGTGTGPSATTTFGGCSVNDSDFTPPTAMSFLPGTNLQTATIQCIRQSTVQDANLTCNETRGTGSVASRTWPVRCPAIDSTGPELAFNPISGSSITSPGNISVSPITGTTTNSGTTSLNCSVGTPFTLSNASISIGQSSAAQTIGVGCTASSISQSGTISCTSNRGGGQSSTTRTWPVSCPAVAGLSITSFNPTEIICRTYPCIPSINVGGTGLDQVTSIRFDWSGPTTSSTTWNRGSGWDSADVPFSSATAMTLTPDVLGPPDATHGTWNWTATFNTGSQSLQRTFVVKRAPFLTSMSSTSFSSAQIPYQPQVILNGLGLNEATGLRWCFSEPGSNVINRCVPDWVRSSWGPPKMTLATDDFFDTRPVLLDSSDTTPGVRQWSVSTLKGSTVTKTLYFSVRKF